MIGADVGPQHARIGAALRPGGKPVHVAVAAGLDKGVEMVARVADRGGVGDADAVEAERERFAREVGFEVRRFDGPFNTVVVPGEGGDP